MNVPPNLSYLPFQTEAIKFCLERPDSLVSLEMGLGKTIVAIGVANQMSRGGSSRVLIVCPATLKLNWAREWAKWSTHPELQTTIVDGKTKHVPSSGVVIVNYELLHRHPFSHTPWDLLVVDESHYCKNPKAQRTKLVFGKGRTRGLQANTRLFLTGTPILNRPIELWPLLYSTGVMKNWESFVRCYCAGKKGFFGWETKGASNLGELQGILRNTIMVRHLKADVLKDLPPKRRQIIELEATKADVIANKKVMAAFGGQNTEEAYRNAVKALEAGTLDAFTEMSTLRKESGLRKIPYAVDFVKNALESGPVVCFCHHKEVAHALASAFPGRAGLVTGDTPMPVRQAHVDRFQEGASDLFVGTIGAAGVGITLTRSSHVIFVEGAWVPAMVAQAEDRCHRIGQKDAVLVQHLVVDGSLDAHLMKTVVSKQDVIDQALDTEEIEPSASPVLAKAVKPGVFSVEPTKTGKAVTDVEIEDIHEALKRLADADGFAPGDAATGKALAYSFQLLPIQAWVGRAIVARARGQI